MALTENLKAPRNKKWLAKAAHRLVNKKTDKPVWYDRSRKGFIWWTPVVGRAARQLVKDMQAHYGNKANYGAPGFFSTALVARLHYDAYPPPKKGTPQVELQKAIDIWSAKRTQTRYSYPSQSLQRMECPRLPGVAPWTDCSGMIRCMWQQLGWPDPVNAGYSIWGNSDSFIQHCRNHGKFINPGHEELGDIVCYVGGVGHAELVTKRGTVLTNGNDAGPYYRGIGQHSGRMYICRLYPFV